MNKHQWQTTAGSQSRFVMPIIGSAYGTGVGVAGVMGDVCAIDATRGRGTTDLVVAAAFPGVRAWSPPS